MDIILEENKKYLQIFLDEIKDKYVEKTIKQHYKNIDFFINYYLAERTKRKMEDGIYVLDEFFDFFVCKCMWASASTIKSTCASFKKFYKCMYEHNFITIDEYDYLLHSIKEGLDNWIEDCRFFDEGEIFKYI